jgi:micrococcal nuclease
LNRYQAHRRRSRRGRRHTGISRATSGGAIVLSLLLTGAASCQMLMGGQLAGLLQPAVAAQVPGSFALCSASPGANCVVDGDTVEVAGERIRIMDYDTPEVFSPNCASELEKGQRATGRLLELLNSGTVELQARGSRDTDKYGRKLRIVLVNGRSVGNTLIAEGLAWPWQGRRHKWCE